MLRPSPISPNGLEEALLSSRFNVERMKRRELSKDDSMERLEEQETDIQLAPKEALLVRLQAAQRPYFSPRRILFQWLARSVLACAAWIAVRTGLDWLGYSGNHAQIRWIVAMVIGSAILQTLMLNRVLASFRAAESLPTELAAAIEEYEEVGDYICTEAQANRVMKLQLAELLCIILESFTLSDQKLRGRLQHSFRALHMMHRDLATRRPDIPLLPTALAALSRVRSHVFRMKELVADSYLPIGHLFIGLVWFSNVTLLLLIDMPHTLEEWILIPFAVGVTTLVTILLRDIEHPMDARWGPLRIDCSPLFDFRDEFVARHGGCFHHRASTSAEAAPAVVIGVSDRSHATRHGSSGAAVGPRSTGGSPVLGSPLSLGSGVGSARGGGQSGISASMTSPSQFGHSGHGGGGPGGGLDGFPSFVGTAQGSIQQ